MARQIDQVSALDGRIRQGKADPISPAEKILVNELREGYLKKFGNSKSASSRGAVSLKSPRQGAVSVKGAAGGATSRQLKKTV